MTALHVERAPTCNRKLFTRVWSKVLQSRTTNKKLYRYLLGSTINRYLQIHIFLRTEGKKMPF